MIILILLLAALLLIGLLYLVSLRGRTGHPLLSQLQAHLYTHRGLFDNENGVPENTLAAFRKTAQHPGYGCEFDVHLLKDGTLVVVHDSDLTRSAGKAVIVEDLTREDLKDYPLFGTTETIPLLSDVLKTLGAAKAPLIVEVKTYRGNAAALTKATVQALQNYPGAYCIESFDPRALLWLRRNAPEVCRGQLSMDFTKTKELPKILSFLLANLLENFLTTPDFIAYEFSARKKLSVRLTEKLWHVAQFRWTIRNQEDLDTVLQENTVAIFDSFLPKE